MNEVIDKFRSAMLASGINPPPDTIIGDDNFYRFKCNGDKGSEKSGFYVLHLDGIPSGYFGCHRDPKIEEYWRSKTRSEVTESEWNANEERLIAKKAQREAEYKAKHAKARKECVQLWEESKPCPDNHPYVIAKGIIPYGAHVEPYGYQNIIVPIYINGEIWSVQRIYVGGDKRFYKGGDKKGGYMDIPAMIDPITPPETIVICEGWATGCSLHQATSHTVRVAFDAGSLMAVAQFTRAQLPNARIILAADDDYRKPPNAGITSATAAANAVGGIPVVPKFGDGRGEKDTDFNDLHQKEGIETVRSQIERVIHGNPFPSLEHRPCFVVLDDWYKTTERNYRAGVYWCGLKISRNGDVEGGIEIWVASPLHVRAVTHDNAGNNFGRLLEFRNTVGKNRQWAMPMELLAGDGTGLRGELLSMGVELDSSGKGRVHLATYLQSQHPKRQILCATQLGWCGDSFVLPDTVIGDGANETIFQSGERSHEEYTTAGTLQGWQEGIAARAVGNQLLMLALSAAFAGALLTPTYSEGGGIHFVGDSSTGKSTLIEAAASVWGGAGFKRSWRSTANGMEGAASMFNDGLLALDEISECDPKDVGAIIYALGNGVGKQRASKSGAARGLTRWKCFIVSSGEKTIETAMLEGGKAIKAGQGVRLLDIPTAQTYGAWDELHRECNPALFSDAIKRSAKEHHGHAGRAFLERLTRDKQDFCARLDSLKSSPDFHFGELDGQEKRAAGRFALLALAGELATEYGVTGWIKGEALEAAHEAFKLWLHGRSGKGNSEQHQIIQQVTAFIDRHGDGRFSNAKETMTPNVQNRAGWWNDGDAGREYWFTPDGLREALKGHDFNRALDVLRGCGALPTAGSSGKSRMVRRVGGRNTGIYPISPQKLDG
jgi:putative DNA primase/helicase